MGPGPLPSEAVSSDGHTITERHGTCCLGSWNSTITQNANGSYDVESQAWPPSRDGKDVYKESRPNLELQGTPAVVVGSLLFVPWLRNASKASRIVEIVFDPLQIRYLTIEDVSPLPLPDNVPAGDKALTVSIGSSQETLWYSPCTYMLDAYTDGNSIVVRQALLGAVLDQTGTRREHSRATRSNRSSKW